MASVTTRTKEIKQPRGGYLNIKDFEVLDLDDGKILYENENMNPSTVGIVVDYLSRFMLTHDLVEAFKISLYGATLVNKVEEAAYLLSQVEGLDDKSIIAACKMASFDIAFRVSPASFSGYYHINPNEQTIKNIRTMVQRSLLFFEMFGPIIKDGFTFEGGYTDTISTGDGDFLTQDILFDFKVSKNEPNTKYTLQILVYYIMGLHSIHNCFKNLTGLGLFNPRLNKVYLYDLSKLSPEIIKEIEQNVICY